MGRLLWSEPLALPSPRGTSEDSTRVGSTVSVTDGLAHEEQSLETKRRAPSAARGRRRSPALQNFGLQGSNCSRSARSAATSQSAGSIVRQSSNSAIILTSSAPKRAQDMRRQVSCAEITRRSPASVQLGTSGGLQASTRQSGASKQGESTPRPERCRSSSALQPRNCSRLRSDYESALSPRQSRRSSSTSKLEGSKASTHVDIPLRPQLASRAVASAKSTVSNTIGPSEAKTLTRSPKGLASSFNPRANSPAPRRPMLAAVSPTELLLDFLTTCQKLQQLHQAPTSSCATSSEVQPLHEVSTHVVSQADMKPSDDVALGLCHAALGETHCTGFLECSAAWASVKSEEMCSTNISSGPDATEGTQNFVSVAIMPAESAAESTSELLPSETHWEPQEVRAYEAVVGSVAQDEATVNVAGPHPPQSDQLQSPTVQAGVSVRASAAPCRTSQPAYHPAQQPKLEILSLRPREAAHELHVQGPLTCSTDVASSPTPRLGSTRIRPPPQRMSTSPSCRVLVSGKVTAVADRGAMAPPPPVSPTGADFTLLARFPGRTLGGA